MLLILGDNLQDIRREAVGESLRKWQLEDSVTGQVTGWSPPSYFFPSQMNSGGLIFKLCFSLFLFTVHLVSLRIWLKMDTPGVFIDILPAGRWQPVCGSCCYRYLFRCFVIVAVVAVVVLMLVLVVLVILVVPVLVCKTGEFFYINTAVEPMVNYDTLDALHLSHMFCAAPKK